MARIRTIKPDFFRHEGLQDLEVANPGAYTMMVFAGLWGHCDSKGRFEWRPRQLKLDILPFLPFDMATTLSLLESANMVRRYSVGGKEYGEIQTFEKHQRLSGKEATEGEKHPEPPKTTSEATGKQQGSNREIPESQEGKGKGKEEEREGKGNGISPAPASRTPKKEIHPDDETALQAACRETFRAYQAAYVVRHGTPHTDNAKVRSQIKQFCQRVPHAEAPLIAAWFPSHPAAKYVQNLHTVGFLLADVDKLRTEWATGQTMSATRAMQSDRTSANMASHNGALALLEAKGLA